jgi:peptidoglycan/xylan/chitin deacetylase (PgdA/CDA1 family)
MEGPGDVTVPIILYHRIDVSPINSRYYVPPEKFEAQMKLLHDWGYTSITTTMLIKAITEGAELPLHPFLLTIDDGNLDNYTNAFPIMQKYGFTGALYLVGNYIGAEGYMSVEQVLEMHEAGWEVGSHSLNHLDLTKIGPDGARDEVIRSKKVLEEMLGIPVLTFAYPFGAYNNAAMDSVRAAGYIGAMGASGYTPSQGLWNLYYLQRVEIRGSEDAKTFTRFLPWHGDSAFLPTDTPAPSLTPLQTPRP